MRVSGIGLVAAVVSAVFLSAAAGDAQPVIFVDEAAEAGVAALHVSRSPGEGAIVETTGSGACFLDFDLDGDLDLYLVQGATLATAGAGNPVTNALYENLGDGTFTDVTARSGTGDNGWGGGCTVGDYDNDGDPDLYVTNNGPNRLFENRGDGTFADATARAGVGEERWSTGAVFFDADRDGHLDLYVANHLDFDSLPPEERTGCAWKGTPVMCGPAGFEPLPDVFFRNRGDGTFENASRAAGVAALPPLYSLGVVAGDVDGDGDADLVVAVDSQPNLLLVNDGTGRFMDEGFVSGLALSGDGREQAGMGVDLGDADGDGDPDVVVTNFSDDYHTLYRNDGDRLFTDVSRTAGLDPVTRSSLGWGVLFFDFDNDGDLDLAVAGGHVYPQVDAADPLTSYRQANLLFANDGRGRFTEIGAESGPGFAQVRSSRALALGDYDDDGDMDLLVVHEDEAPSLLRNDGGNRRRWLKLRLIGRTSNRDGIGARVRLEAGGRVQVREQRLSAGYLASHDPRLHFGLDRAERVERLTIDWPAGKRQVLEDLPADRLVTVDEQTGLVSVAELPRARRGEGAPPQMATEEASVREAGEIPTGRADAKLSLADVRRIDALVQAGTRHLLAGRHGEGIARYEEALEALPPWEAAAASPDALGFGEPERYRLFLSSLLDNLGVGRMRAEHLTACVAPIERAIEILPERAKYYHNLGLCHFHGRRYDAAVAALERARAIEPERSGLSYDLGRSLALAGRCGEAEVELRRALDELPEGDLQGRDAESWYHLAGCRESRDDPAGAAAALREVLARTPGHQKALYKLGLALRRSGEETAAARVEELFRHRQPAAEAVRTMQRAGVRTPAERLALGRAYLDTGLPTEALYEARTALATDPASGDGFVLLGEAALALSPARTDVAERAFERALRLSSKHVEALVGLADTYRRTGRTTTAREVLLRALAQRPEDPAAQVAMAHVEMDEGRTEAAAERLRELLGRHPAEPAGLIALAEVHVAAAGSSPERAEEALELLDQLARLARADLYGETTEVRVRALQASGATAEARRRIAESPFLGSEERRRLLDSLSPPSP